MAQRRQPKVSRFFQFLATPRASRFMQVNLSSGAPGIFAGYALIGAVMGLGSLGYMLDRSLDTAPLLVIVGLAAGVCLGFYNLVMTTRRK